MKNIDILSINIKSSAERLVADHQSVTTAFRKIPVKNTTLQLTMTGIVGDTVHHTDVHGGNDKAICCYNADHFNFWADKLGLQFSAAAFGENLTLTGETAHENHVYIGDRYQLGEAIVEVSEPRGPCFIIGIRHNYKQFPVHVQETGFSGYYLRTIQTGKLSPSDKLIHLSSHPEKITVMSVNYTRYHDTKNKEMLSRLVNLKELTIDWRERFEKMLNKLS